MFYIDFGGFMAQTACFSKTLLKFSSIYFSKTLDYKLGVNPNEPTAYTFTGDKTYNSQIAKNSIAKAKKSSSVLKKAATSYLAKKSLLAPNAPNIVEPFYAMQDMTLDTQGVSYGGTDITGSYGGSLLEGVFDKNKQERIMSFYKNMNIFMMKYFEIN